MDIYGIKKNILVIEQVFLDITKVLRKTHVYKSIQLMEQVFLDMTKVPSVVMVGKIKILDGGNHH